MQRPAVQTEALLVEVQDTLRTAPVLGDFEQRRPHTVAWVGRASAVIERWDVTKSPALAVARQKLRSEDMGKPFDGFHMISTLLFQAEADLQMQLGRSSVVIESGQVFQYFEEIRKLVESARSEVFFVDPYLDVEIVSRYLPYAAEGTVIRLLGRHRMSTLLPAVEMFCQENTRAIEVRSSDAIHDRYLFLDRSEGHISGASFKDGAKSSPALISRVTDAFQATWDIYERNWTAGTVHR